MSRPARFQHVETFDRGRVVAHILDTASGRHHWVHRVGDRLLEWDRQDAPVKNALLRREARSALDTYAEKLERRPSTKRGKSLSLADRIQIRDRSKAGESTAVIAESFGVHPSTVQRSLRRVGA